MRLSDEALMRSVMQAKINIGVVGAGKFGGFHLGKCLAHEQLNCVGIFDKDSARARDLAEEKGVNVYDDLSALFDDIEAVIIASPATTHAEIGQKALAAGLHILVEKPFATSLEKGEAFRKMAQSSQKIVQVGHQERYVAKAIGLDRIPERPIQITAKRLNRYSERGTDTSVTLDLMTHDIDLVNALAGGLPDVIEGESQIIRSQTPDTARAKLEYNRYGITANLEASRVADDPSRILEITYPSGLVRIDLNNKTLLNETPFDLENDFGNTKAGRDSLAEGMAAFVHAITTQTPPLIGFEDGYQAMRIALKIDGET